MKRLAFGDERGSTIPLVLGFFVIALLVVAGAVLASDAFTKQRDLQSVCDGAALAASNAIDGRAVRTEALGDSLPLAEVQQASEAYLAEDPARAAVQIGATLSADGATVLADCRARVRLAFGAVIGHPDGVDEHATASARGVVN